MIKTIARYLILILLICGGFYLVNVISTNVDNTYSDVSDITFNTNHSYYCANYDYDGIDQTIVYRNDRTNEDIFSDSNYAFLIDETTGTV
ncbi:MAG: hypothetical protein E7258_09545, partial [Lachnospiraceae bacterium]|nr:hypothetical protein [Lachnospiraceae bacterium]